LPDLQERLTAALTDRYRIAAEIGSGGMAVVFRADDRKHNRPVAIKVLKPHLAVGVWADRFLREIQIAAGLQHLNILPLYDSGEVDGLLYYVMPLVTGESLRARLIREGPLPVLDALQLAREVAEGLGYAHARGVVHRDIKPGNILLSSGHALICDFGIARALALAAGDAPTDPGLAIGTPAYMSPEQSAATSTLDARADIYSLGCVLFEMLAGETPFRGSSGLALIAQHNTARPPSLRRLRNDVPIHLEDTILRAMAKLPEQRFASAGELAARLSLDPVATSRSTGARTGARTGLAILVLPFADLAADPESEYLTDGITEELIQALAQIEAFRVVARTSAFAFKGKREDVREIGERLRVDLVVDGSVRLIGGLVKISVQLVDTSDGYQLWSAQYERRAGDTLVLEDEIAHTIASVLRARLAGEAAPQPAAVHDRSAPARDPAAHEAYLKGRYHWNKRTEPGIVRSIGYFEQAITRAPDDPPIHAALADSYLTLGIYGSASPDQVMPKARASAERALALDRRSAEAHTALGCVSALYQWSWRAAEDHFRRAVELKPGYPTAHQWRAMHLLLPLGRFEEGRRALEQARQLDPLSPAILTSLAVLSFFQRDWARAVHELDEVLELDSGFAAAHYFLGQAHLWRSEPDQARNALSRAVSLTDESVETVAGLAYANGLAGRGAEARAALDGLISRSEQSYVSPIRIAQIYLGLGERDRALDWLGRALDQRATDVVWIALHPMYDSVREEPRFVDALERTGLAGAPVTTRVVSSRPPPTSVSPRS